MCCNTQDGPDAFLGCAQALTGRKIGQKEWHALREIAKAEAIRMELVRGNADELPSETFEQRREQAIKNHEKFLTKERATKEEINHAALALVSSMNKKNPNITLETPEVKAMLEKLKKANNTKGTIRTIEFIAENGLDNALYQVKSREREFKDATTAVRHLREAAELPENAQLKEGLLHAAALNESNLDGEPAWGWIKKEGEDKYPGLMEAYNTARQGPKEHRRFSMFTKKGNEAVYKESLKLRDQILKGKIKSEEDAEKAIRNIQQKLSPKYGEVYDTEPRSELWETAYAAAKEKNADWAYGW